MYAEARRLGYPSIADALRTDWLQASWMKRGLVLLAVDAALATH